MKQLSLFLSTLLLIFTMSSTAVFAQENEPISLPPPPKEGAISGVVTHMVQVTAGDDETIAEKGRFGQVEHIISLVTTDSMLDSSVTWTLRSRLQHYDYGNSEDVQGASDNWTDTSVYKLEVLGELYRNGDRVWHNHVPNCCNVTSVSSGFSPWFTGYNAFWQSKGTHYMQNTSGSGWNVETSEASKQF
jgi:hypothetical protein